MKKYFFIFFFTILFSCSDENFSVPDKFIQPEKITEILTDIHIAESIVTNKNFTDKRRADTLVNSYYESIFKKYKTDSVTFRKSWEYYCQHAEIYDKIQEKVVDKLNEMQVENSKQESIKK